MTIVRSIVAVLGGLAVISLLVEPLEFSLVNAVADAPIGSMQEYFAVRNRPGLLAAKLVYNALAAVLGGYLTAKIAGTAEMRHGALVAAAQTAAFIWGFTVGDYASYTPVWMRVALTLVTAPAILAGAAIRHAAAQAQRAGEP